MLVKTMLLCGIIVAGAGTLFLLVVGRQWWRAMNRAEEDLREEMGQEGQITGGEGDEGKGPQRAWRGQWPQPKSEARNPKSKTNSNDQNSKFKTGITP